MSQDQHAGRHHNIKKGDISFERVEQFKYLGTTLINKNSIHKKNYNHLAHLIHSVISRET
jgi:hypothetical protein